MSPRALTTVFGEYMTTTGTARNVVAVRRGYGPTGWCLLDVPVSPEAPADDFKVVRRFGDPAQFGPAADRWVKHAVASPLAGSWFEWSIVRAAGDGALVAEATVDIYTDRHGMRRLILVEDVDRPVLHLVDVPVDPQGTPGRLVAMDVAARCQAQVLAESHVECELLRAAAERARCGD